MAKPEWGKKRTPVKIVVQSITTCRKTRRPVRNATPYSRWSKQLGGAEVGRRPKRLKRFQPPPLLRQSTRIRRSKSKTSRMKSSMKRIGQIPEDTSDLVGDDDDDVEGVW